jgi:hypothetical protein
MGLAGFDTARYSDRSRHADPGCGRIEQATESELKARGAQSSAMTPTSGGTMLEKTVPCRLFVISARRAPVAAVLRRGPSKWVQLNVWDTSTDSIEHGQWFHGRIYERRCDLSPDGRADVLDARARARRHCLDGRVEAIVRDRQVDPFGF